MKLWHHSWPRIRPLGARQLDLLIDSMDSVALNYAEVGATARELPAGYSHVEHEWTLGSGEVCYAAARRALLSWRMLPDASWFRVHPDPRTAMSGETLSWSIELLGVWWFSAVRLLPTVESEGRARAASITFGTLPAHYACGEERFEVAWLDDDRVVYRLRSFSRWNKWLPRFAPWLARSAQRRFARQSAANLESAVRRELRS